MTEPSDGVALALRPEATLAELELERLAGRAGEYAAASHGRALTEAAARCGPRPAVLSSTALGLPLYRSMGFRPRARAQWWAMSRGDSSVDP